MPSGYLKLSTFRKKGLSVVLLSHIVYCILRVYSKSVYLKIKISLLIQNITKLKIK